MTEDAVVSGDSFPSTSQAPECLPVVFLLDDDPSVLVALGRILQAHDFSIRACASATEFLEAHDARTPGCLVTDLCMPGKNGLEVQRALLARGIDRPIIFITGHGDIRTTVQGMRAGAVTFLSKPVSAAELVAAVREAITKDAAIRVRRGEQTEIGARLARLTRRERQVLCLLTTGLLNKQIAAMLGSAEKTIKVHRGRLMRKMRVRTAAALMGLLHRAQLPANLDFSEAMEALPRPPVGVARQDQRRSAGPVSCVRHTPPSCCA
jgi:FixJ family two-component response regulator